MGSLFFISPYFSKINVGHENKTIWSQSGVRANTLFKRTPEPTLDRTLLKVSSVRPDKKLKCKDFVFLTL